MKPLRSLAATMIIVSASLSALSVLGCQGETNEDGADSNGTTDDALTDRLSPGRVCTDPASPNAPLPCPISKGLPDRAIAPALFENGALFGDAFYQRYPLHQGRPLFLNDSVTKTYSFPTRYRDGTTAMAMFFCDWQKAKALMPHPSMEPIDMGLGRSLVVVTTYRYNRVFGIKGYNEAAITIPVLAGRRFNPPVLPLLISDFKGLGFYVQSMPVTTVENDIRGRELWGLPKFVQEINLKVDGNGKDYISTVKDPDGKTFFELKIPMAGDESLHVDASTNVFSKLRGTTYRSPSHALGDYAVTKWMSTLALPLSLLDHGDEYLKLGDSPAAQPLKDLGIARHPFQVRFSKSIDSVFDLPDAQLDEDGQAVAPASYQ